MHGISIRIKLGRRGRRKSIKHSKYSTLLNVTVFLALPASQPHITSPFIPHPCKHKSLFLVPLSCSDHDSGPSSRSCTSASLHRTAAWSLATVYVGLAVSSLVRRNVSTICQSAFFLSPRRPQSRRTVHTSRLQSHFFPATSSALKCTILSLSTSGPGTFKRHRRCTRYRFTLSAPK